MFVSSKVSFRKLPKGGQIQIGGGGYLFFSGHCK